MALLPRAGGQDCQSTPRLKVCEPDTMKKVHGQNEGSDRGRDEGQNKIYLPITLIVHISHDRSKLFRYFI